MAKKNPSHLFSIDLDELEAVKQILNATEKEMMLAYNRALKRTAISFKSLLSKKVRDSVQARKLDYVRKRLKDYRVSTPGEVLDGLKFWVGLNDMAVHSLKGRMKQKSPYAYFSPKSKAIDQKKARRGFVLTGGKLGSNRLMFQRFASYKGAYHVVRTSIDTAVQDGIEDKLFNLSPEIFLKHFETDLKGRIAMRKKKDK